MDRSTLIVSTALMALLLAEFVWLELRARRKNREAACERRPGAGDYMTRQHWRSNGQPPPGARPSRAPERKNLVPRGRRPGYGFAVVSVLLACVFVAVCDLLFSFPPLIFFAAAVAATLTLAGTAPGLFALVLATLLSDFFFVRPRFVFSLDWQVLRLSLVYLLAGLLSALISKLLSSRAAAS